MSWLLGLIGGSGILPALAALLFVAAWGGAGWYGKANAELELERQQLAAANVITERLVENQRLAERQALAGAEIAAAFEKGKQTNAKAMAPALADLQYLRSIYLGVREPAAPGASAVPSAAGPAGEFDGAACTDEPGAIIRAADQILADLAACADTEQKLINLQRWVREVIWDKPD